MLIIGIVFLVLLLTFLIFGLSPATFVVAILYPGYETLRALEAGKNETEWLTYWTIFGIFSLVEDLFYYILSAIPLYSIFRLAFFVYLLHPRTQGANVIYDQAIRPVVAVSRKNLGIRIE